MRSRHSLLLAILALTVTAAARAEREVAIADYTESIRGRVIEKIFEALGEKAMASVEISGIVTHVGEGVFFLQRDDDGLKIQRRGVRNDLRPGDVAVVSGKPFLEGGRVILRAETVRKTAREPLPAARTIALDDLVDDGEGRACVNWLRVTLSGRVLGLTDRGFAVDVSGVPVNVMCREMPAFLSDAETTHPKVAMTGVIELMLDQSSLVTGERDIIGVKLNVRTEDVTLMPDLAYYAAKRTRGFVLGVTLVSVVLSLLLFLFGLLVLRQRRRLFRSRTLMGERKRMADDLHDTIEQHLVGAGMLLKLNRIKEAEGVLVRAKREIRDIVWGLKNDDMMRLSPADMLRQLAHEENTKGLFRVDTKLAGLPMTMEAAQMRDLSLIVREAIGNAIKHGGAKKIAISSDPLGAAGWLLRIANDGRPFDPALAPGAAEGHFGLEGMHQRARRLGAEVSFAQQGAWMVLSVKKGK